MSLIGTIGEMNLADVVRLFAAGRKTGLLTVAGPGRQAMLRFHRGSIVHAASGRLQGDDAVLDLFGWKEGQLTFVPEDRAVPPNVMRTVDELIAEGVRVGDELHRRNVLVPTDRVVFQTAAGPPDGAPAFPLTPGAWRVLLVLDGVRDVRELAEASGLPREEVVRAVFAMAEAGFLERIEPQRSLRVQSQGLFAKEAAAIDERIEAEWKKLRRFTGGVRRVEVRGGAGKAVALDAAFRPGLQRDIHLPRSSVAELGVREGDDVHVRPLG
jgi:DNA-binding MarR family transcriptional regulator